MRSLSVVLHDVPEGVGFQLDEGTSRIHSIRCDKSGVVDTVLVDRAVSCLPLYVVQASRKPFYQGFG